MIWEQVGEVLSRYAQFLDGVYGGFGQSAPDIYNIEESITTQEFNNHLLYDEVLIGMLSPSSELDPGSSWLRTGSR